LAGVCIENIMVSIGLGAIELYSFSSILGTILIPFLGYFLTIFLEMVNFLQLKFLLDH